MSARVRMARQRPARGGDGRRRAWSESPIPRVATRRTRGASAPTTIPEYAAGAYAGTSLAGIHNNIQFSALGSGTRTYTLRLVLAVGMDAYNGKAGSQDGGSLTTFGVYLIPWTTLPIDTGETPTPVLLATVTGGPWATLDEVTTSVELTQADALDGFWYLGTTFGIGLNISGGNGEAYLSWP